MRAKFAFVLLEHRNDRVCAVALPAHYIAMENEMNREENGTTLRTGKRDEN